MLFKPFPIGLRILYVVPDLVREGFAIGKSGPHAFYRQFIFIRELFGVLAVPQRVDHPINRETSSSEIRNASGSRVTQINLREVSPSQVRA